MKTMESSFQNLMAQKIYEILKDEMTEMNPSPLINKNMKIWANLLLKVKEV